ncbi:MAG: hypothetical protein GJ676_08555 [Rhodobacteraceae bacterium]|nr:hypothetical protein [Paracoccaceae bacterium]
MAGKSSSNLILGLCILIFAAVLLGVWIPADVQTGLIEKVRRQVTVGDALAPTVAGLFLLLSGVLLVTVERQAEGQPRLDLRNLGFTAGMVALIFVSLIVMRWSGPLAVGIVNVLGDGDLEYRLLRDTAPWKFLGYFVGGTLMISGCVAMVEGRIRLRAVLVSALAVLTMIAIYDLPFDDLILPPNGDV